MTNDFATLEAESETSRFATFSALEHKECQAYLDAQVEDNAPLRPCQWSVEDWGDSDCRKETLILEDNGKVLAKFSSVESATVWAQDNGWAIQNPPRFVRCP
jgi:hypothetical protein